MNNICQQVKRPILRYHGGKWRLAPWVIQHFPKHLAYVEPYGGAGSVLAQKKREKTEVWNDLNSDLFNLFSILRTEEKANELVRLCELTPFARQEFDLCYEPSGDPIEKARRFIIRSFFGFGSKACLNIKQNGFRSFRYTENSPAVDWRTYPEHLSTFIERFKGVVIEHEPAINVIKRYDREETLFYCDPPYVHSQRKTQQAKYSHELTDKDHEELAEVLHNIKGMALISGYHSALYGKLFNDWECVTTKAHADMASYRIECLWISPKVSQRLKQRQMSLPLPL